MKSTDYSQVRRDYERIEEAIKFIEARFDTQPGLQEIADHVGLSEFHFQRLFSNWVGISPKRFLQFITKEFLTALSLAVFIRGLGLPFSLIKGF